MKKPKLLLLDANVVIHLFELGIWTQVICRYEVRLSRIVVEQEAQYYEDPDGSRNDIDLNDDIDAGRIQVFEESPSHLMAFRDTFDPSYLEKLDDGETESLVHLLRQAEDCWICSADKIVFRILGNLRRPERGISLKEVLNVCRKDTDVAPCRPKTAEQNPKCPTLVLAPSVRLFSRGYAQLLK